MIHRSLRRLSPLVVAPLLDVVDKQRRPATQSDQFLRQEAVVRAHSSGLSQNRTTPSLQAPIQALPSASLRNRLLPFSVVHCSPEATHKDDKIAAALLRLEELSGRAISLQELCDSVRHCLPAPYRLRLEEFENRGASAVAYRFTWRDQENQVCADARMQLTHDDYGILVLNLSYVKCERSARGNGFATALLDAQLKWLQSLKIKPSPQITLIASGVGGEHVGSYFWAASGFEFKSGEDHLKLIKLFKSYIASHIANWTRQINAQRPHAPMTEQQLREVLLNWAKEAKQPADYLRPPPIQESIIWQADHPDFSIGKSFLLNTCTLWSGKMVVDSTARLSNPYVAGFLAKQRSLAQRPTLN